MSETSPALLLGAVLFLILAAVGIFIATLVYLQRSQSKAQPDRKTPGRQPQQQLQTPSAPQVQEPKEAPSEPIVERPDGPGEVMRVLRDRQTGRILVEVGGKQYAHIREISDAQAGRRVLWAIADLLRFTGGMAANPQAVRNATSQLQVASVHQYPPEPASAQVSLSGESLRMSESSRAAMGATQPTQRTFARRPRVTGPAAQADPSTRERYSLLGFFAKGFRREEPATQLPEPRAFIDEIEEILQGYIESRPTSLPFQVHVQAGPDGALQIKVGLNTYSHPDEVPDPEVRKLIEAAVAEWERR